MGTRVAWTLRFLALVSIATGLVGGFVWSLDLMDRTDGDDLRWGFWHNPRMGFTPFNEPYLDASMWILWTCSAAIGLGGILLLAPTKLGARLVVWQAPVSIFVNASVLFVVLLMACGLVQGWWKREVVTLRAGSIAVNLVLWRSLASNAVKDFFALRANPGLCARCSYDLSGIDSPECPECGVPRRS